MMSYQREQACPKPAGTWEKRCRLLEADDVAARSARYGGRASRSGRSSATCTRRPPAPLALDGEAASTPTASSRRLDAGARASRTPCWPSGARVHHATAAPSWRHRRRSPPARPILRVAPTRWTRRAARRSARSPTWRRRRARVTRTVRRHEMARRAPRAAAALLLAAPADAYRLGGRHGRRGRSRTTSPTPQYKEAIRRPRRAPGTASGVGIRFKQVGDGAARGAADRATATAAGRRAGPRSATSRRREPVAPDGRRSASHPRRAGCGTARPTPRRGLRRVRCVYGAHVWLDRVAPRRPRRPVYAQLHGDRGHARARPRARPAPRGRTRAR